MDNIAKLIINGTEYNFPIITGTEGEQAIDISSLRQQTGLITLDPGYANTGSCKSEITFVDGEKGIVRYRGYTIEDLSEQSSFIETAMLLIFGELPTALARDNFRILLSEQAFLHEGLLHQFDSFPPNAHPMAILSATMNALGTYHPELRQISTDNDFLLAVAKILSKVRTIAAFSYRASKGLPFIYPHPEKSYCNNFLHMMFSDPYKLYEPLPEVTKALSLFFIIHADHEQNCSTSTVRMVGSSQANLFSSVSAAVCALWGKLHGGANAAVINQLQQIQQKNIKITELIKQVKAKKIRLMGFGHRVYKSFDPRANILKQAAINLLKKLNNNDPLLEIAEELEQIALSDSYFLERNLYPNVDFYSGIILKSLGIPTEMFPVLFAIGRMPGWIAQWSEECVKFPNNKIHRPRQIYIGPNKRKFILRENRTKTSEAIFSDLKNLEVDPN